MKDLRKNYTRGTLDESGLPSDPLILFNKWFDEANDHQLISEANAMVLSTVNNDAVDSRFVLLKDLKNGGFVFFTNYNSNKGQQLEKNGNCTLLFPWIAAERQVIIRGKSSKISEKESTEYFLSRPVKSQIGAWASDQSSEVDSREKLDIRLDQLSEKFKNQPITKPPHWGGFAIAPTEIEFWQGRENRLHDRILYRFSEGKWSISRLQP